MMLKNNYKLLILIMQNLMDKLRNKEYYKKSV